jgi:hypothetical protein
MAAPTTAAHRDDRGVIHVANHHEHDDERGQFAGDSRTGNPRRLLHTNEHPARAGGDEHQTQRIQREDRAIRLRKRQQPDRHHHRGERQRDDDPDRERG